MTDNLYVALVHYPVVNKRQKPIGSALTTIDMHDIARASITFGVKGFLVITPYEDQAEIAVQVIEHWTKGVGGTLNPHRKQALELIHVVKNVDEGLSWIQEQETKPVITIATSAKAPEEALTIKQLRAQLSRDAVHVVFFGTAWGLADELIDRCDHILEPIKGVGEYNHLSVRSAASIYLDRIINGGSD